MSNLLSQASLVMIPSGYKEDVVYSQIPTDGAGDLSFTRASNGTRINSAGLVEDVPWNLLEQSNSFNTTWAIGTNTTLTSGFSDPFGGGNAWRLTMTSGSGTFLQQTFTFDAVAYTFSVWAKANGNTNLTLQISGSSQESYVLTNEWQRITFTYTPSAGASQVIIGNGILSVDALIYGAQLNIGSTAKPYFPTTDRLNVPRLTYQNGGGGCPSLLLEPQRTNLALWSEDLSNASWSKVAVSVTANTITSPDGTTSADTVTANGVTTQHAFSQTITSGTIKSISIFAKAGTHQFLQILTGGTANPVANYDLVNGTSNMVGSLSTSSIENYGDGWYRCILTTTDTVASNPTFAFADSLSSTRYPSTSTSGTMYIWGAQCEVGAYATSYIPTTSSSATRVADDFILGSLQSNGIIGSNGLSFFVNFRKRNLASLAAKPSLTSASSNDVIGISTTATTLVSSVRIGGGGFTNTTILSPYNNEMVKVCFTLNGTTLKVFVNGSLALTTTASSSSVFTQLSTSTSLDKDQEYKQILLFPTPLTDAECQALTTL